VSCWYHHPHSTDRDKARGDRQAGKQRDRETDRETDRERERFERTTSSTTSAPPLKSPSATIIERLWPAPFPLSVCGRNCAWRLIVSVVLAGRA
jgi:hypothetical protein